MPVHQFVHDQTLLDKGLRNYWGYNTIGFLAPHNGYSASGDLGQQVPEFKAMVRAMHTAGIEVILDVVYNHNGRGQPPRPTISMRGVDNQAYYRLVDDDPQFYMDYTGTGKLPQRPPSPLAAADHDSLRYWVTEMHVDGFRFDLASDVGSRVLRGRQAVDVLRARAAGPDDLAGQADRRAVGRRARRLPGRWVPAAVDGVERQVPRHDARHVARRAGDVGRVRLPLQPARPTSTSRTGAGPWRRSNFVTAHDGFTLADLVSYNEKHNDANGEDGNDGESHNRSWNSGAEGPTDDNGIRALRARQQRNFLATLLLSQGVPMILHGDELGRTQDGNNNTYAQDSELSWIHWDRADLPLVEFVAAVVQLRRQHPLVPTGPLLRRPARPSRRGRTTPRHRVADRRRPRHAP